MPPASAAALLAGVVDYAGLFPPAALSMRAAAAEYQAALASPDAWMLGRFVVTAARLTELADALAALPGPRTDWRISAIVRDNAADDWTSIAAFNRDRTRHHAHVDTAESKPQTLEGIDWLAAHRTEGLDVYVEIAPGPDVATWLARVADRGLRAKMRTGGLTAEAFPAADALAACLAAVVASGVPFKVTAGLHHAVRGTYRLTYDTDAAQAPMYGYLNVLLAATTLRAGRPVAVAEALLRRTDAASLVFAASDVRWGDDVFSVSLLRETRARHLVSVGSCSFCEPAEELGALLSR